MINSIVRDSFSTGVSIIKAKKINIKNTAIINSIQHGISLVAVNDDITIESNIIVGVAPRSGQSLNNYRSGYSVSFLDNSLIQTKAVYRNNIAAGCSQVCFVAQSKRCPHPPNTPAPAPEPVTFEDNVAHSGHIGWLAKSNYGYDCHVVSKFTAYRMDLGVYSYWRNVNVTVNNLILAENKIGASINTGLRNDKDTP